MSVQRSSTLEPGAVVPPHRIATIGGGTVDVPDEDRLVHLQFRRFAGCPVCNLHLQSFVRRHDEIVAAGVHEVVVFHSTVEDLLAHEAHLPFAVVADPDKVLYREFGVESSPRALADPRAWLPILRAVAHSAWGIVRHRRRVPPLDPPGGRYGLPADLLVEPDGCVRAAHYGTHAGDQWSVDEVLRRARPGDRTVRSGTRTS